MHLRWSEQAAGDLDRIANYLFEKAPLQAPELVRAIYCAPPQQRRVHWNQTRTREHPCNASP